MKKTLSIYLLALLVAMASSSVGACPKGTHPVGGTGPHHKGGTCK